MIAREARLNDDPPLVGRPDWAESFPWLVHGVTTRERGPETGDYRLYGPAAASGALERWEGLRDGLGMNTVVHARQVHGSAVRVAREGMSGILLAPPCDGHITGDADVLLTVAIADCVPVFLLEPESRRIGLLHAGWRGVAAGIVERGIGSMWDRFGVPASALHVHLGPAISASRYEVSEEVFRALGLDFPGERGPLDLRAVVARRAVETGVPVERVGISEICVGGDARFHSHRGGDAGRQVAVIGYHGRPGTRR